MIDAVTRMAMYISIPLLIVVFAMLVLAYSPQMVILTVLCVAIFPACFLTRYLLRRGAIELAAWYFIIWFLIVLLLNTMLIQGLNPLLVPGFFLVILAANLFLPPPQPYIVAALASALYLLAELMRARGFAAAQMDPTTGEVFLSSITVLAFIFMAFLNQLVTGDLRRALDDATQDLIEANRKLAKASEMKSQFTARTSHELRTPLSSIIAFTDLALRESYGPLTPKLREALGYVFSGSKHLKDIINDLLDLSKIEAGQVEIADEDVSLPALVETVRASAEEIAKEKGIQWSLRVSPEMPAALRGDASRLAQILVNLAGNAVKFTETGEVDVDIDRPSADRWRMSVRDTGPGIPEDQFDTIFEAYRQLNGTASPSKVKGTGLGLAITRHLVRLMGGSIHVESTLGKGSTFTVELPLRPAPAHA
jgi:signal transduction histidine kinase